MDTATCNMKEPQKKYRIGTVGKKVLYGWVGGGGVHVLLDTNLRPLLLQWFETFGPHKGF